MSYRWVRANLRYLRTVLRHKWFVYQAGRKLGVGLWQLLVHDLSKFSRAEWGPYVRRFEGGRAGAMDHSADPEEFHKAFEHHWRTNLHHWDFWTHLTGRGAYLMPEKYAREMVADWMGASRAYTGKPDCSEWYTKNRERIILHPNTRTLVEDLMGYRGTCANCDRPKGEHMAGHIGAPFWCPDATVAYKTTWKAK